jgi:hypothetical protein
MSAHMTASTAGQDSPSVDDLVARIRDAHTAVTTAFSNALDRAIDAGETLIITKKSKLIAHGQWGKFLEHCGVGARQAERYMRLACLVAANPTCKSDLAELSIEQAIKRLSDAKPTKGLPTRGQLPKRSKPYRPDFTGTDIIAAWIAASPNERTRALNGIGLNALLAAVPRDWWSLIESIVADRHPDPVSTASTAISGDLEIPTFLRRAPVAALQKSETVG